MRQGWHVRSAAVPLAEAIPTGAAAFAPPWRAARQGSAAQACASAMAVLILPDCATQELRIMHAARLGQHARIAPCLARPAQTILAYHSIALGLALDASSDRFPYRRGGSLESGARPSKRKPRKTLSFRSFALPRRGA